MTKTKSTKRALLMSALALLMCVSMLIGSTFAWFTDSVTSAGNTIQSGTLKVDLVDAQGNSLEGKVLEFDDLDDNDLWEPGCTYNLQEVHVANKGTLALKYEIAINGITGDAKLLEAIEWTVTMGGTTKALSELNGFLLPNTQSDAIVLSGHMKEEAGNEYQGLTVDGISISVFATQYTYEKDSIDDQYDNIVLVSDATALTDAIAAGKNVMLTNDVALDVNGKAMTVAADADVIIDLNGNDIVGTTTVTGASQILFEVKGELTVVGDGTIALYDKSGAAFNDAYENAAIYVNGGVANLNEGMIVTVSDGAAMAYAADAVGGNSVINVNGATLYSSYIGIRSFPTASGKTNTVNYNSGVVYGGKNGYDIWTQEGSGSSVVNIANGISYTREDRWGGMYYVEDDVAFVSNYAGLTEAVKNGGKIVLVSDITVDKWIMFSETKTISSNQIITVEMNGLTIDGNGHTLTINAIESAGNGNLLFDDASNLNISNLTIKYADGLAGGINLESGVISNVTFIGGGNMIYPGTGEIKVENCTFNGNGTAIYNEHETDGLTVTGCTFNLPADNNVILIRGDVKFTNNTINSGRTVNVVSGSPEVTGNDFNDVRLKVYSAATATISGNTINNLVFSEDFSNSTFAGNNLSAAAQAAFDALN